MATGVPGEEIVPIVSADLDFIDLTPAVAAGASSQVMALNNDYSLYVDNSGTGGNNTRAWLVGPVNGEIILGPRGGTDFLGSIRLKTSATTASAANCNISTVGVIARSTSSLKYKRDITDHEFDLDALRQLRPVEFHDRGEVAARAAWQERYDRSPESVEGEEVPPEPRLYVGLIAEEVEALGLHEFVVYDPATGQPDALMYDRIVVGVLALVHAQQRQIDDLADRLAALEAKA